MSKTTNQAQAQAQALPKLKVVWYASIASGRGDGDQTGLTTGLRLTHYCNELLRSVAIGETPNDNATLERMLKSEFPNRKVLQSMKSYKSYFSAGDAGFNSPKLDAVGKPIMRADGKGPELVYRLPGSVGQRGAKIAPPEATVAPAKPGKGK